ncbi:hypothetical protein [Cylindrospermopsis raciborskii]|uniref:hypothetical protein n=1 Tax=Cylindrospermopsis raciborskii TaxID=77022 RepID=UPI001114F072|nr:hypothetical protein [Cylindrospermopsis raciborskii]NLQ04984.1 hypothetical protein [Cylindrospermopsis raciborskii MVCC19]
MTYTWGLDIIYGESYHKELSQVREFCQHLHDYMTTFINTDYGYGNRELNLYSQNYSLLTDLYQLIINPFRVMFIFTDKRY